VLGRRLELTALRRDGTGKAAIAAANSPKRRARAICRRISRARPSGGFTCGQAS
jgi:hypothetical protein